MARKPSRWAFVFAQNIATQAAPLRYLCANGASTTRENDRSPELGAGPPLGVLFDGKYHFRIVKAR
jgi:hypothetical protein